MIANAIPILLLLLVIAGWLTTLESDHQRRVRHLNRRAYERALADSSDALLTADILLAGWKNGHTPTDVVEDALSRAYAARQRATAAYFAAYPEDRTWK